MAKTIRAKCLEAMQLLRRLEEAEDGYCTCVSCGKVDHYKKMHGGHFIAKGHSSRWALEEINIHPQCPACNAFGMKNGVAAYQYYQYMAERYGQGTIDRMMETRRDIHKISAAEYRELLKELKERIKKLES